MNEIAQMPAQARAEIFAETADRKGLAEAIIEKDFWVCWTLKQLGLDCSHPAPSFLSQTVSHVAHWLMRSHQADGEAGPLRWITPVLRKLWPLRL